MSELDAHKALSSEVRVKMLRLLYRYPMGAKDLAKQLNIQPVTVRHHLKELKEAGLLESQEFRSGGAGRPKTLYEIAKKRLVPSFPRRQYLSLSDYLIGGLQVTLGKDRTGSLLRKVGIGTGERTAEKLASDHGIKEWTPEAFRSFFVDGYLTEVGGEPEIVEIDDKKVVYRLHNCLFFELAMKMPEMVCDILHDSFHQGLAKKIGKGCRLEKTKCMAHGDLYCEHRYEIERP